MGTGLKKWSPMKRSGPVMPEASSLMGMELVLLATRALDEMTGARPVNTCLFTSRFSKAASITRSAWATGSNEVLV